MAQFQFETEFPPLTRTQISVSELAATFNACYALHGYLGGFDAYRRILDRVKSPFLRKMQDLQLDKNLKLAATNVHILTSRGPIQFVDLDAEGSFGGDCRTQLIGLTLCALAHEIYKHDAVDVFMTFLAPCFFGCETPLIDALNLQLHADSVLDRVLNEGASRGFTDRFNNQVANASLPSCDLKWSSLRDSFVDITELRMVGGLLRWMVRESTGSYKTRSGLVARVALYLKEVGYSIGTVQSWDGKSTPPARLGPRAVLLVLGGSSDTDSLMGGPEDFPLETQSHPLVMHYNFKTVGATIFQGLAYPSTSSPEVLQDQFEKIYNEISQLVHVTYELNDKGLMEGVSARFHWQQTSESSRPLERSIAAIYFPLSANYVAPLYRDIATSELMECARDPSRKSACPDKNELELYIVRLRATTAAIILALTSRLSPSDFETARHCTGMELGDESWIQGMCSVLDKSITFKIPFYRAAWLLGAIHLNLPVDRYGIDDNATQKPEQVIGYQSGIYTVLPNLLIKMEPSPEAVGLACKDIFFANLEADRDGTIRSSSSDIIFPETMEHPDVGEGTLTRRDHFWSGDPSRDPPDTSLYFNFERSVRSRGEPLLCLAGRIRGTPTATVDILDVLKVILLSLDEPKECAHTDSPTVTNVRTSYWSSKKLHKPVGTSDIPTFIPVVGDMAWTLFLAGQACYFNPRIVFRCVQCAKDKAADRFRRNPLRADRPDVEIGDFSVLIGYLPDQPSSVAM